MAVTYLKKMGPIIKTNKSRNMKFIITSILALMIGSTAMAGNGNEGINPTKKLFEKWQKNFIIYPKESLKNHKKGVVFVSFQLDENGHIKNIAVEEGVSEDLNSKAIEIAKNMPTAHLIENGFEENKVYILPVKFSIK